MTFPCDQCNGTGEEIIEGLTCGCLRCNGTGDMWDACLIRAYNLGLEDGVAALKASPNALIYPSWPDRRREVLNPPERP